MGIRHPIVTQISKDTFHINEFGLSNMYVLRGSERSLVIDAGTGYCDFKAIIESLTDKPYDIAITHAHADHAGMMHQFDKIYINAKEITDLGTIFQVPLSMDNFERVIEAQVGDWQAWEVTDDMINQGNQDTKIIPLEDGHVFDLGNRKVTSFELAGHTLGGMYFIDDCSRIAFTGDCCHPNISTQIPVSTTIRNIKRLQDHMGKDFDCMFSGHVTYCGTLDVKNTDPRILENVIEAYRSVLRGDAEYSWVRSLRLPGGPISRIALYGPIVTYPFEAAYGPMAQVGYIDGLLWEKGEEHIIP
jgi:hydroxyacylglutathione hydrolase